MREVGGIDSAVGTCTACLVRLVCAVEGRVLRDAEGGAVALEISSKSVRRGKRE